MAQTHYKVSSSGSYCINLQPTLSRSPKLKQMQIKGANKIVIKIINDQGPYLFDINEMEIQDDEIINLTCFASANKYSRTKEK